MRAGRCALVCDFDGVLFDWKGLQEVRWQLVQELGIDADVFVATYKKTRVSVYKPSKHARLLAEHLKKQCRWNFPLDAIVSIVLQRLTIAPLNSSADFVFPDARRMLSAISRKQSSLDSYILSNGDHLFQTLKIQASGLYKPFTLPAGPDTPRIFVTEKRKGPFVKHIAKCHDAVMYYDDKLGQLEDVARFMKNSGMGKYPACYVHVNRNGLTERKFWQDETFGAMRGTVSELDTSDLSVLESLGGAK